LNAITVKANMVTFYGPNVLGKLNESDFGNLDTFFEANKRSTSEIDLNSPFSRLLIPGDFQGQIVGGNLSSFIISILGSSFEPNFSDMILVLESGSKTSQELSMLLSALRNSKLVHNVRAIIFGDIPIKKCSRWGDNSLDLIVEEMLGDLQIPIVHAPIFGHKKLANPIFPIGMSAKFNQDTFLLKFNSKMLRDNII